MLSGMDSAMTSVGRSVVRIPRTTVGRMVSMKAEHDGHSENEPENGLAQQGVNLFLDLRSLVGNDDYLRPGRDVIQACKCLPNRLGHLYGVGLRFLDNSNIDGWLAVGAGDARRASVRQLHIGHITQHHGTGWTRANYQVANILDRP